MKDKLAAFGREYLSPGDHVIVAVSGGKDSMALLHGLWSLSHALCITVSAAHYNHHLRGAESDRDAEFVQTYCNARGIPLALGHGNVAQYAHTHRLGLEESARFLRYEFLLSLHPEAKIATAHTAEDNLETVLMHLIRGSGLHGLTGIPPVRDRILRPMLQVTRPEIAAYLSEHQIPHVEDSTNESDAYLRNRIRHQVLPALIAENPRTPQHVSQLCQTLRAEDAYLNDLAETTLTELCRDSRLDRRGFLSLPEVLQYRVMGRFLRQVPELQRVHLTAALALARSNSPSGTLDLPGAWRLCRRYDTLALTNSPAAGAPPAAELLPGQTVAFGPWLVRCEPAVSGQAPAPGAFPLCAGALTWPLTLRSRQPGDRIRLSGGTKKLSDLMIDQKIPAHLRDTLPVVCTGGEIAAVLPLNVSRRFAARDGQDSVWLSATRMED